MGDQDGPWAETTKQLVERCLERLEAGDSDGLDAVLREHPERADDVRRRLDHLRRLGMLEHLGEPGDTDPRQLGPFKILQRIGRGGMGVVYAAFEEPLGRQVALKLIRADLLYERGSRARFRREVEVLARLRHPAILPVYRFGEDAGVPYYAMQYVEGVTLEEMLRVLRGRRPHELSGKDVAEILRFRAPAAAVGHELRALESSSWVRAWLRMFVTLAEVLAYTHGQGILHRDIKPSNIMLSATGQVLLFDFGLASTADASRVTRTGSQIGSLAYMAPEQLRGETPDERSDLYGLGVTLAEMLTLRNPFLGPNAEATRQRILEGMPPAIRATCPAVPWEAETVCLKAIDRDPARRYASAEEMAADLGRALERRPISARRAGPVLRMRRLVQRHPTRSVAAVLGGLVFVGAIAFAMRQQAISRALRLATAEKDDALGEARAGFLQALRATNDMLREVADSELRNVPGTEALRRKLLDRAAAFYDELLAGRPTDVELRLEAARGFGSRSAILRGLGELDLAEQANARAVRLVEELRRERAGDRRVLAALADVYQARATLLAESGRLGAAAAIELERKAVELDAELVALLAADGASARAELGEAKLGLASHQLNLLAMLAEAGRFDEADTAASAVLAFTGELVHDDPTSPDARFRRAMAQYNAGALYNSLGRHGAAEAVLEGATGCFDALIAEQPDVTRHRVHAAGAWFNLGSVQTTLGKDEEGLASLQRAEVLCRDVIRAYPAQIRHRVLLIRTLLRRGVLLCIGGRHEEDAPVLAEGSVLAERFRREHETVPGAHDVCAAALIAQGWCGVRTGRHAEAEASLRAALAVFDELARRWPDYEPATSRGDASQGLARCLRAQDRLAEARAVIEVELADARPGGGSAKTPGMNRLELAEIACAQGDARTVAAACRALLDSPLAAQSLRRAAGLLAGCIAPLQHDAGLGESERSELVEACARDALALLERALREGWSGADDLETAADIAALRARPAFAALLARVRDG